MTGLIVIIVLLVVVVLLGGWLVSSYNSLVASKAHFENAFSQIEVQLIRRYDLIPNMVEVAKKYMQHESQTLENVIAARNGALSSLKEAAKEPGSAAAIEALNGAEKNLASSFNGFRVQFEAYPELKADTVMMQLSEELVSTENKVAFARQGFNDAATDYNIRRNSFPVNVVAGMFGHKEDAALLVYANSEAIQTAPKVSF